MINNYGCTPNDGTTCNVGPGPDREPIAAMLSMANDLTAKALDMTLHISSQVLGSPMPDMNTKDPMCISTESDAFCSQGERRDDNDGEP